MDRTKLTLDLVVLLLMTSRTDRLMAAALADRVLKVDGDSVLQVAEKVHGHQVEGLHRAADRLHAAHVRDAAQVADRTSARTCVKS